MRDRHLHRPVRVRDFRSEQIAVLEPDHSRRPFQVDKDPAVVGRLAEGFFQAGIVGVLAGSGSSGKRGEQESGKKGGASHSSNDNVPSGVVSLFWPLLSGLIKD